MTVPLMLLAVGSVFAGWLGVPQAVDIFGERFRGFERWLEPAFASAASKRQRRRARRLHRVDR